MAAPEIEHDARADVDGERRAYLDAGAEGIRQRIAHGLEAALAVSVHEVVHGRLV